MHEMSNLHDYTKSPNQVHQRSPRPISASTAKIIITGQLLVEKIGSLHIKVKLFNIKITETCFPPKPSNGNQLKARGFNAIRKLEKLQLV